MSEQHPNGEDIARMLREQGPARAPEDLSDEVMRQVRAEQPQPQRARRFRLPRMRSVLVPALGLATAAALVVGVAHLGSLSGSSSSAGASSGSGGGEAGASEKAAPQHAAAPDVQRRFVISSRAAKGLTIYGLMRPPQSTKAATTGSAEPNGIATNEPYTLTVKGNRYDAARDRLQRLALAHAGHRSEPSVIVTLRRKP